MDTVFIDETFDLNLTTKYHLSIQAGLNGYSFSVLDPLRNKYILLKHFSFESGMTNSLLEEKVAEIQKNDEFLCREYKSVFFAYQTPKYTLIPGPLFNKDNLRTYFEFNHFLEDLDVIHYNSIKTIDACNLFVIPSELSNIVQKSYSNVRYFHPATSLIEYALINHGGKKSHKVVTTNIYGNIADIAVIEGENLLLCNSFPWKNEQDLVYFILYIYEQLRLNGEETPLVISGEMSKMSPAYDLLKSYIKNIEFEKRNDHFVFSYTFNDIEPHWFVNLFNLRICV